MKVIMTKHFPPGSYIAINLFGVVFAKKELPPTTLQHEAIHSKQMAELGYIFFYLIYGIEFLCRFIVWLVKVGRCTTYDKDGDCYTLTISDAWETAYRTISFETEAYECQGRVGYLKTRKHYAQWRKSN
jgi:hypothetical protein